jgi:putative flippase GtrA
MIEYGQVIRYLCIGTAVTLIDVAIFMLLSGSRYRFGAIAANCIATTVGLANGFILHLLLVFRPEEALLPLRFMKYVVIVAISVYGVQNLVIYTLAEVWRWPVRMVQVMADSVAIAIPAVAGPAERLFCKFSAVALGMVWNFFAFKCFVYA